MTVRRVMGIETEYGISVPGDPTANPMLLSGQVVNAYAQPRGCRARPGPLGLRGRGAAARRARVRDEPGRRRPEPAHRRARTRPSPTWCSPTAPGCYVDHAHPEYSSPEVTTPRDAVRWDRAGERIMLEAVRRRSAAARACRASNLYKNNTDGKGASYGTHENYLMRRRDAVRRHRAAPHRRSSSPARSSAGPAGSASGRTPRELGLPDRPARRLLRGRGRAWRPR